MSVGMFRFGGDSCRFLNAVMESESVLEVARYWHPGDSGDLRFSEDIRVIVEVGLWLVAVLETSCVPLR
jgi:hypothetical protein